MVWGWDRHRALHYSYADVLHPGSMLCSHCKGNALQLGHYISRMVLIIVIMRTYICTGDNSANYMLGR